MSMRKQLLDGFEEKRREPEFWIHLLVFALLGVALWPVTQWVTTTTHEQSRLLHALSVLALATVALVRFGGVSAENVLEMNSSARRALIASFAFLTVQFIGSGVAPQNLQGFFSLLIIPAYCCGIAALVRFTLGEGTRRLTRTASGTLCAFLLLSILMQPLDWPLRGIAGIWSASVLTFIGQTTELGLLSLESGPPKLILLVNQRPFHVASECNGFGVILTSLLLALMLGIYRRRRWYQTCLGLSAALIVGFAFNVLRIVVIVLLAPYVGERYMLMHEIIGGITYWSCLVLIWLLIKGPTDYENADKSIVGPSQNKPTT